MTALKRAQAGVSGLERLAQGASPLHRLHPLVKILVTAVYIVVVVSFPSDNVSGLTPFLFYPCILVPLSGTPWRPLLIRLLFALPFALMGGLGNMIFLREPALQLGNIIISRGLLSCVSIMLKTVLTVLALLLLSATTPLTAIGGQLAALRLPRILCLQFTLTYRYLAVLLTEAGAMFTAYSLRALGQKRGINWRHMGSFLGQLLLRSFERAERVYQAMKCRGFSGVYPGPQADKPRLGDWLYAALICAALVSLRWFNLSLFLG